MSLFNRKPVDDNERAIGELLERRLAHIDFQPIVELATGGVFAYEALARSDTPAFQNPLQIIGAALKYGRIGALGRFLRTLAVENGPDTPLFLNIHPNEFAEGWLVRPDDPVFSHTHHIFIEITESVPISHFEYCHSVLNEVRSKGVSLAVDDLGAGYSNLKYIADLKPEVVKLDRELIIGLTRETRMHTLVTGLVRLCSDLGARVVCEGIETAEELSAIIDTGAQLGQGYYLARPGRPPPIPTWKPT